MTSIVIGASSAIARAAIQQLLARGQKVHAISRRSRPAALDDARLIWWECAYDAEQIEAQVNALSQQIEDSIDYVLICNGLLHTDEIQVEKKLDDLDAESFHRIMDSNALTPALWLRSLLPLLKKHDTRIAVFSARIGSIGDNRLGGWYSYRASKAALNMLLKTAAVEYARIAKGVKLVAFHPGTTDTPLSKPFQAKVPEGKLFTPDFVATRLLDILDSVEADRSLSFLDWDGQPIDW